MVLSGGVLQAAPAPLRFDVFLGFDGVVPEASWFPIVFEAKNDGPAFSATVEVEPTVYNQGQKRSIRVELPTGTLKRFVLPVFSGSRGYSSWDIRLRDGDGNVRAEQLGVRASKQPAAETVVMGALARTPGGAPTLRPIQPQATELQPVVSRLQAPIFPDDPLVLEGMDALYLNSEKAGELNTAQAKAIVDWVQAGGHLVVALEQIADVEALPWLKELYPCEVTRFQTASAHPQLQQWLNFGPSSALNENAYPGSAYTELRRDPAFEETPLLVATARVRKGAALVMGGESPLVVQANRGFGKVTALLFNPEREPFRSWKNAPAFWSKLTGIPPQWYERSDYAQHGRWSSDGIFGAMIDSRQIHKLPVGWLLVLLLVYLLVIGPLDQYWLKRIGKPMLTWLTFPAYVVLFSGLIYAIGYKLRAGDSEWNELHVVDVLSGGNDAAMRGRTYLSIYSPANQRFSLQSNQGYAAFRGEFAGTFGGQTATKGTVAQTGEGFSADVFVPVWSSQLFVSDWFRTEDAPVTALMLRRENSRELHLENRWDRKLVKMQLAFEGKVYDLADLAPGETRNVVLNEARASDLAAFVTQHANQFQHAVQVRLHPFGNAEAGRLDDLTNSSKAASFLSTLPVPASGYQAGFISPAGLDLSSTLSQGTAVLFAWTPDYSPIKKLSTYSPRRSRRDTLWRIAVN